jgi:hypothetical protein
MAVSKEIKDKLEKIIPTLNEDEKAQLIQDIKNKDITKWVGISDKMPKGLGTARFFIKNIGSRDPQEQVEILNTKYGNEYDFKLQNGTVLAKNKKDYQYGLLDPSGFDWRDITDVAYDVGSGAIEAGLTGLAAASSGLATMGVGAIPAAAATSGLVSAGSEALRQEVGKLTGFKKDVSGKDIAIAGGSGAIAPLAVKGVQKLSPAIIASITNTNPELVKTYLTQQPALKKMFSQRQPEFASELVEDITKSIRSQKDKLGKQVSNELEKTGKKIDISDARAIIDENIQKLTKEKSYGDVSDDVINEQIENLKEMRNLFGSNVNTRPSAALKAQQLIKDKADYVRTPQSAFATLSPTKDIAQGENAGIARDVYNKLNDIFEETTSGASKTAKDAYKNYLKITKLPSKNLQEPQKLVKAFTDPLDENKRYLSETIDMLDELTPNSNLKQKAINVATESFFKKPKYRSPITASGILGTLKQNIPAAAGGLVGYGVGNMASDDLGSMGKIAPWVGLGLGAATGNVFASPAMTKNYLDAILAYQSSPQFVQQYSPYVASELLESGANNIIRR